MLRTPFVRHVIGGIAVVLLAATAGCGGDDTVTAPTLAATTVATTGPETVPTTLATTTTMEAAAPTTVPPTTAAPTTTAPPETTSPTTTVAPPATPAPTVAPTTTTSPPAPTTTPACREVTINDTMRRGDCGSGVVFVQERLTVLGFPTVADGFFGPNTETAVKDFQTDRGLTADGIVGLNTWAALTEGGIGD